MVTNGNADEQSQRHMEHEIGDMISKLTHQLTALGKSTARNGQENEDADHGVRIITLAGDNKGATMKANLEEMMDTHSALHDDQRAMSAYANSNYQAVNNSILLNGSCKTEDPGVHIVMTDYADEHGDSDEDSHDEKKEKKEEKKEEKEKEKKEKKEEKEKEKKEKKEEKEKEKKEEKERKKEKKEKKKEKKEKKKEKKEGSQGERHSEVEGDEKSGDSE